MSYSFSAQGATKDEVKRAVSDKFAEVVENQPVHAVDLPAAKATVETFVDLLAEPAEGDQINVSVSGYVSWRGSMDEQNFTGANVSIGVSVVRKE